MARNENRSHRSESVEPPRWRAGADTWHDLLLTVVALMCVVPTLLVGALVLLEVLLPNTQTALARRNLAQPELPIWQPTVPPRLQLSAACMLLELTPCRRE